MSEVPEIISEVDASRTLESSSNWPVGTLEELAAVGLSKRNNGSCSRRGPGNPIACAHFDYCRFKPWRDRNVVTNPTTGEQKELKGPVNCAISIQLSPVEGATRDQRQVTCHQWYDGGWAARQRNQHQSGERIRIIAYEGDGKTFKDFERVSANPKDPLHKKLKNQFRHRFVEPFRRITEMHGERVAEQEVVDEIADPLEREAYNEAMAKIGAQLATPPAPKEAHKPATVGEPEKVPRGTKP